MWQPDPAWQPVREGVGASGSRVWRAELDGRGWAVKRVDLPGPGDPDELHRPTHPGYWRRELELARAGPPTTGLVAPEVAGVEEDAAGYVVRSAWVEPAPVPGLFAARALGRLAGGAVPDQPWLSRRLLAERVAATAARGGWTALARTPVAPLATELWSRREPLLARYDALPQRPAHGDPVPGNLLRVDGADLVAVDWASFGLAPPGADLGYLALSRPEDLDVLLDAFLGGMAETGEAPARAEAAFAARLMAVLTVMARADWALRRADHGPGELTAKLRHPSVSPYLRALQRQLPAVEQLLGRG